MASSVSISNICSGVTPSRVVLGLVKNTDYDGTLSSSPFFFRHYDLKRITLKVSSVSVPYSSGLSMDYKNNNYLEAYWSLFQNIQEKSCDITYAEYKEGHTLYAFDLSPDMCNGDHVSLQRDGTLELDLDFAAALTDAVSVIFYMEFTHNSIEITKQRNVLYDYQI
jgi:hypothetical protein